MNRPISAGLRAAILMLVLTLGTGCFGNRPNPDRYVKTERVMTVTGYCDCKKCTGWKRNWLFRPVYADGPRKGERKKVGITASGTKAKPGTLAADTRYYPFGTRMYIPGYGYGTVEDRGSAIKGDRLDLFFKSHKEAERWGVQKLRVTVWTPRY